MAGVDLSSVFLRMIEKQNNKSLGLKALVAERCRKDGETDLRHRCHVASSSSEQDFLSRWYEDGWYSFLKKYNWQVHQSLLFQKDSDLQSDRFMIENGDLRIVHFSKQDKPRVLLFHPTMEVHEGIEEFERRHSKAPSSKIRQMIIRAQKEWYEAFRDAYLSCDCKMYFKRPWRRAAQRSVEAVSGLGGLL